MADVTAVVAEPSTAQAEVKPNLELHELSTEQRSDWLKTGNLPARPPKTEGAEPSPAPGEAASAGDKKAEPGSVPEPETGKQQEPKPKNKLNAEERISQLNGRVKAAEERARAAEERAQALESGKRPGEGEDKQPEPPAGKKAESKDDPEPKLDDFIKQGKSYEDFNDARMDWKVRQGLKAARDADAKAAKDADAAKENARIQKELKDRFDKAVETHEDFAEVAKEASKRFMPNSAIDQYVLMSENGEEVLYHLGKNPDEFDRLHGLPRMQQFRELQKIDFSLRTPATNKVPAKKVTSAPPPAVEVGARGTAPPDEAAAALKAGNFSRYQDLENAKDLKRLQKG